jgi:hypothetical protein
MSGIINSAGSRSGVIGYSGDIVASGSNANGHYIKFSSGQLIQWFKPYDTPSSCTGGGYGGWTYSDTHTFTFPLNEFNSAVGQPVSAAACSPYSQHCQANVEGHPSSNSQVQLRIYSGGSASNAGTLSYITNGTWK